MHYADLGGGGQAWYVYDASGERVRKVIEKTGGIVEQRLYLGGYEVYRKTISGSLNYERETLLISDDTKKIAHIETITTSDGREINPVPVVRYQYDNHLGSAYLELDVDAAIISYEEYHPFGTTSYRSGRTETEVSMKRYKYVGKERDEETGLYYYGARYYAGWLARFVSVDPLQFNYPQLTPFNYGGNKPVTHFDIDGMQGTGDKPQVIDNKLPDTKINTDLLTSPEIKKIRPSYGDIRATSDGGIEKYNAQGEWQSAKYANNLTASRDLIEWMSGAEGLGTNLTYNNDGTINHIYPYDDKNGNATIGYGHLINNESWGENNPAYDEWKNGITLEQALTLKNKDLDEETGWIKRNINVPLTQNEFDALLSAKFNGAAFSELAQAVNTNNFRRVQLEFLNTITSGGEPVTGLLKRRGQESQMYLFGMYPTDDTRTYSGNGCINGKEGVITGSNFRAFIRAYNVLRNNSNATHKWNYSEFKNEFTPK